MKYYINTSTVPIVVLILVAIIIIVSIIITSLVVHNIKNNKASKEEPRELSYKQEQYLESLRGSKDSPYYGSNKIGQTTYKAFSDYIFEFYGYEQETEKNKNIIREFIGNFDVLPDGDKNITWPRTTTYLFDSYSRFASKCLDVDDDKIMVVFHTSSNELYKKIKLFFKERNIEIKNPPKIKPFSIKTNQYAVLDKNSEECTFLHYLLRVYYGKDRSMFGFQQHEMPKRSNFESFKKSTMQKYNLKTEYEFSRYLMSFFYNRKIAIGAIMLASNPDIESIRDYVNKWKGYNSLVWDKCRAINKELSKKLKTTKK